MREDHNKNRRCFQTKTNENKTWKNLSFAMEDENNEYCSGKR